MMSRNLEKSLHRARAYANDRRHEHETLEHLLLALIEDQDAVAVLRACGVGIERLRREVQTYVDNELGNLVSANKDDAKPTPGFQRVLQRAAIHVRSLGREEVTGANVLVAMCAEHESHAVYFLQAHGVTRFDAVNYITNGVAKAPPGDAHAQAPSHGIHDLTLDELAVVDLLRGGRSDKLIALELSMSEVTVEEHVRNILNKLRVTNRTGAAIIANRLLALRGAKLGGR